MALRVPANKCTEFLKYTIDCNSLPNDLFCILITNSDSASDYGSFECDFLSSIQRWLLIRKRISQIREIIMGI
uniref:Uncharacterized protein n=1 Tax=Heterorhabditis bacteriophora TaxID=37862 RepID=A0A1I7WB34_HETBA